MKIHYWLSPEVHLELEEKGEEEWMAYLAGIGLQSYFKLTANDNALGQHITFTELGRSEYATEEFPLKVLEINLLPNADLLVLEGDFVCNELLRLAWEHVGGKFTAGLRLWRASASVCDGPFGIENDLLKVIVKH